MKTIFYSWMSDRKNATNRGFIKKALENAIQNLQKDEEISIEARIESDTQGLPGSPDIFHSIRNKIDGADAFVADVSFIPGYDMAGDKENIPNPNVLIELGYALKSRSDERIIMVFNEAFGNTRDLPFDLGFKRVISYNVQPDCQNKAEKRKDLAKKLEKALRTIFEFPIIEKREQEESEWLSELWERLVNILIPLEEYSSRHGRYFKNNFINNLKSTSLELQALSISKNANQSEKIASLSEKCDELSMVLGRSLTNSDPQILVNEIIELSIKIKESLIDNREMSRENVEEIRKALQDCMSRTTVLAANVEKYKISGRIDDLKDESAKIGEQLLRISYCNLNQIGIDVNEFRKVAKQFHLIETIEIVMNGSGCWGGEKEIIESKKKLSQVISDFIEI